MNTISWPPVIPVSHFGPPDTCRSDLQCARSSEALLKSSAQDAQLNSLLRSATSNIQWWKCIWISMLCSEFPIWNVVDSLCHSLVSCPLFFKTKSASFMAVGVQKSTAMAKKIGSSDATVLRFHRWKSETPGIVGLQSIDSFKDPSPKKKESRCRYKIWKNTLSSKRHFCQKLNLSLEADLI